MFNFELVGDYTFASQSASLGHMTQEKKGKESLATLHVGGRGGGGGGERQMTGVQEGHWSV